MASATSAPAPTAAPAKKDIIILGGAYAGISTAHYTLRNIIPSLPNPETYHLTLVDPSTKWVNRVAAPRGLVSEKLMPTSKWMLDLKDGFTAYKPEQYTLIQGLATGLSTSTKTVTIKLEGGETRELTYYALIIATGASSATPLYQSPYEYTVTKSAVEAFRKKLPEAKTVVIAGGGPSAVETAGEIGHFLNGRAGWFSSRPKVIKSKVTLVTSGERLVPALRPSLGKKAEKMLNKVGVDVVYNTPVTSTLPELAGQLDANAGIENVTAPAKISLSNGETLEADLYIPAYGLKPNTSWVPAELLDGKGKVNTNPQTLRVDEAGPRVYAIGEAANYGYGGIPELMMSAFPVLFVNIKRDLLHDAKVIKAGGNEKSVEATGKDKLFVKPAVPEESVIVPVGRSSGVGAFFGWYIPSFMVWLMKGRSYMMEMNKMNLTGFMYKSEQKWKDY